MTSEHNFDLGINGFSYSDLFDAVRLKELADKFYSEVLEKEPVLGDALNKYITNSGQGYEKKVESKILTDAAPFLSDFIARLFKITTERSDLERTILEQDPVWKYKFFVQRRAIKKYKSQEDLSAVKEVELEEALRELRNKIFADTLVFDEELAVAVIAAKLVDAEESLTKAVEATAEVTSTIAHVNEAYEKLKDRPFGKLFTAAILELPDTGDLLQIKAALDVVEKWSAFHFHKKDKKFAAFKVPHALDYQNLVHLIHPEPKLHNIMRGSDHDKDIREYRIETGGLEVGDKFTGVSGIFLGTGIQARPAKK
jgi:hypothetical protein